MTDEPDDTAPDQPSPWAREIPVTPAPTEFVWVGSAADGGSEQPGSDRFDDEPVPTPAIRLTGGVSSDGVADGDDAAPEQTGARRSAVFAGAALVAVVALVAAFVVAQLRNDGDGVEADLSAPVADSSVVDDGTANGGSTDAEPETETTEAESDTTDTTDTTEAADTTEPVSDTTVAPETTVAADEPVVETGTVALPARLAEFPEPFTLAMISQSRGYLEIDVPSGEFRQIELTPAQRRGRMLVGASTTLIALEDGFEASVVLSPGDRDAAPVTFALPDSIVDLVARPGTDEFVGTTARGLGPQFGQFTVIGDGTVAIGASETSARLPWETAYLADGSTLVGDSGGVYRIPAGGDASTVSRLAVGDLVGANQTQALIRECDERLVCGFVVISTSTGERTDLLVPEQDASRIGFFNAVSLAPDGRAFTYLWAGEDGPTGHLVDGASGASFQRILTTPGEFFGRALQGGWAPDSSGVFRVEQTGLVFFLDRETGESELIDLGDLDDITQIGVRPRAG